MKKLAIPVFTLMLILGMNATGMAIDNGTYDFYGLYKAYQYDADAKQQCTLRLNGLSCPTTAAFCFQSLIVSGGGTAIESGLGSDDFYGLAVGVNCGSMVNMDSDGGAPLSMTIDDTGASDLESEMTAIIDEDAGGCGETWCLEDHTYGYTGAAGGDGTVKGTVGIVSNTNPTVLPGDEGPCDGEDFDYDWGQVTTGVATAIVNNKDGEGQTRTYTGTPLEGDPPYALRLVTPNVRWGTTLCFGSLCIKFTDTYGGLEYDGTLCERTSAGTSCIPGGFTCPAYDDDPDALCE